MKKIKYTIVWLLSMLCMVSQAAAQCALCTKTAQQLGDGPASGLNKGILYLMGIPLCIMGIVAYKWYKKEKAQDADVVAK